jgi:FkbM family methyltransferase
MGGDGGRHRPELPPRVSLTARMLGGRHPSMVAREIRSGHNYLALWRMWRLYPRFLENVGRYFLGRGDYPYVCHVRTPSGIVAPTLFSRHDMWTMNEVFCRQDYGGDPTVKVVVDVGSNIGISALFFLTRNESCRCWLFEPVPTNVERLRGNLAGYEARYTVAPVAVAPTSGRAEFGVEESGRYGGIGVATGRSIAVDCVGVNAVLEEVLGSHPTVDVLKVDTEGTELEIVRAIRPELLRRVRTLYLELERRPSDELQPFDSVFHNQTWVLRNRALSA